MNSFQLICHMVSVSNFTHPWSQNKTSHSLWFQNETLYTPWSQSKISPTSCARNIKLRCSWPYTEISSTFPSQSKTPNTASSQSETSNIPCSYSEISHTCLRAKIHVIHFQQRPNYYLRMCISLNYNHDRIQIPLFSF